MSNTLFIGLGRMGRPMARHISRHFPTVVHDILRENIDLAVEDSEAAPLYELNDIGVVDTMILMLPTSTHVESILVDSGLLEKLKPGALVIDMGSSVPDSTRKLAAKAVERGIDYVDAPVSGGVAKATSGELAILVGGEPRAVERARPYLEAVGKEIVVVGGNGAGHAAKAINNLVSATNLAVATEALIRGRAAGIAPERMIAVLNTSTGMSQASQVKFPNHILTETYASNFAYDLMLKDLGIAMGIETPNGATPVTQASYELLSRVRELLGEYPDHTEITRAYERYFNTPII
ncbi:NAD(P)-dependent oxidoreductase [Microbacterium album]|uniref:3-hydroxyisobutyrate dehydrogenase n=1 Tax=Microbacterium album TaxID=2053191 RepID=A0A917MMI6_9MICO|nr:NAD(P)-dependent oxidoreductase [Microbacterium album]GGH47416.1 3-hydroxyisobutyrate dehydrogenase [Microbacterium album]